MTVYYHGRSITIGTQGILRPDSPLTVGVQGILEPQGVSGSDITLGGSGGTTFVAAHIARPSNSTLVITGRAPVVNTTANVRIDIDVGIITITGRAPVVNTTANVFAYVANGTLAITGYAPATTIATQADIIVGGSAGVVFKTTYTRGGKGTPASRRRTAQVQKQVFYYTADALRDKQQVETAYGLIEKSRGVIDVYANATTSFRSAPKDKYQFIKSLPPVPKIDIAVDSELVQLYKELAGRKQTTHSYNAVGGLQLTGKAKEEYFDFANFIITQDDELIIADILSTKENPFLTTSYDIHLSRRLKDDDELLSILEIF